MLEAILSVLILLGAVFVFIGALGLARLQDFYTRLHGPTKATTLGVGSLLIASLLYFSTQGHGVSLHEGLVTLFLFITAPVSAHLLAKAALHLRVRSLAAVPALVSETDHPTATPALLVPEATAPPRNHAAAPTTPVVGQHRGPGPDSMDSYRLGAAAIVLHLMETRFGRLSAPQREQIALASLETLLDWSVRLLSADSAAAVLNGPHPAPASATDGIVARTTTTSEASQ